MRQLMTGLTLALLYVAYCLHERGDWLYAGGMLFAAGAAWETRRKDELR